MTAIVIIPARYDSTRFPGKPLTPLNDKPLIRHVYENSKKSKLAKDVIIATDSEVIFKAVTGFGGKVVMTSDRHTSGTDRIAEAAVALDYDIIVNVQGDEPLIRHEMIDDVISLLDDKRASIGTLIKKIENPEDIFDPNVVKVVCDKEGFAMYFSRAPIPFDRESFRAEAQKSNRAEAKITFELLNSGTTAPLMFKHLGIYSYRRDALLNFAKMEPVELEQIEKLEQLRALVNGLRIKVKETFFETIGVDTPQDLERVKKWLSLSS
ncbi:MAG: 3-deoxy-manno-octulosonate cytidylyltransferase [Thermodesulfovibrionales bacterium]|nr:3-deoxy-manno-octulosonate cytidylyltransferase [Thermodesulfovibrionales bacterium]